MRREDFFSELEQLYARLDAALPSVQGNPCGTCKACCTARGLSQHVVSDLELDYLRERAGPERADDFRRYAARERDAQGDYLFEVCPNYDLEAARCSVYAYRPYSCRTFGHFRAARTAMPEVCVFRGQEVEFPPQDYFSVVPEARRIHQLKRDYMTHRRPGPVTSRRLPVASLDHLDPSDPVDRAWVHLLRSQFQEALEALQEPGEETPFRSMSLGLALAGLGRWVESGQVLSRAVEAVPDNADLRFQLARVLLEQSSFQEASEQLDQAVRLNPMHAPALGYRGYVELAQGQFAEGIPWLERSLAVDPDQPEVQGRLERARELIG
ncbi:MAG: tetratricopeptide repeat protein [Candidatus Eremiobacterota bacterium]